MAGVLSIQSVSYYIVSVSWYLPHKQEICFDVIFFHFKTGFLSRYPVIWSSERELLVWYIKLNFVSSGLL